MGIEKQGKRRVGWEANPKNPCSLIVMILRVIVIGRPETGGVGS